MNTVQELKGCTVLFCRFGIPASPLKYIRKKEMALGAEQLRSQFVAALGGNKQFLFRKRVVLAFKQCTTQSNQALDRQIHLTHAIGLDRQGVKPS